MSETWDMYGRLGAIDKTVALGLRRRLGAYGSISDMPGTCVMLFTMLHLIALSLQSRQRGRYGRSVTKPISCALHAPLRKEANLFF